jgi:hypothetical protein
LGIGTSMMPLTSLSLSISALVTPPVLVVALVIAIHLHHTNDTALHDMTGRRGEIHVWKGERWKKIRKKERGWIMSLEGTRPSRTNTE